MEKVESLLERAQSVVGFIQFVGLTVILSLQILMRFVVHKPLLWSEEVARFLLFWLVLNGAALAVKRSRNFMIELFDVEAIKHPLLKGVLQSIPLLGTLSVGVLMVVYGSVYMYYGSFRVVPISRINMLYVYLALPLSGLCIVVYSLGQARVLIQALRSR